MFTVALYVDIYIPWESRDVVLIVFGESTFLVANDSFRFMDHMLEAGSI